MCDKIKDDSSILHGSIGKATIIKYIPQDKRLGVKKNYRKETGANKL